MSSIIEVAIAVPLHNTFDYLCDYQVNIGARVSVPFGRKKVVGVVLAEKNKSDYDNLRSVEEVLDKDGILSKEILDFLFWSANYYHHPIGEVLLSALPKNLRQGKPAVVKKLTAHERELTPCNFETTKEQKIAIDAVLKYQNSFHSFLIHGVTGSGKTEVYLRVTESLLKKGRQVLVLVPEIGLTPQMISRFEERVEAKVVSIHSQLNETQKTDAYLMAKNAEACVILGTRSAIFTPIPRLGLVIVDEEHDDSFKQQSGFRLFCQRSLLYTCKVCQYPTTSWYSDTFTGDTQKCVGWQTN